MKTKKIKNIKVKSPVEILLKLSSYMTSFKFPTKPNPGSYLHNGDNEYTRSVLETDVL